MNHQQELVRRFGNEKTPRPTEQRIPEHVQDDRSVQPQDEENAHRASLDTITASRIAEALQNHDLLVQDHRPLVAKLGRFSTACLIINKMIGTGIFETPETIWRGSGTAGGSLLMWCLGSLIAFAGMTVYLELGLTIPRYNVGGGWRSVPRSGGEKNYLEWLYPWPRFMTTCTYAVIFIFLGNTAGNSIIFAQRFLQILDHPDPAEWVLKGTALATITMACLLHGVWRAGGIWMNNAVATFKVGTLWFIIIAGLVTYNRKIGDVTQPGLELEPSRSFNQQAIGFGGYGTAGWMSALLDVCFSYGGFENANYVLSEVKNPQRHFKKSSMAAVSVVSLSYLLTNISFLTVVTADNFPAERDPSITMSTIFFEKVFYHNKSAQRALPALIAISAFGNIVVTTFVAAKVKQEIAKEGILPFSSFWRSEYLSPFTKLRSRFRRTSSKKTPENTPIPALLLHWLASLILVLAPPRNDAYTLFVRLYSYMLTACFGTFLAGGLLYVGYLKPVLQRFQDNPTAYRWRDVAGYSPFLGPVFPMVYFLAGVVMVFGAWVPVEGRSRKMTSTDLNWYIVPTVGVSLFGIGIVYWMALVWILPLFKHKSSLRVTRTPYLDRNENFRYEEVKVTWLDPEAEDSDDITRLREEVDPDLGR